MMVRKRLIADNIIIHPRAQRNFLPSGCHISRIPKSISLVFKIYDVVLSLVTNLQILKLLMPAH